MRSKSDLVEVHARLPFPFAHRHPLAVFGVELHAVAERRERGFAARVDRIPLDGRTHRHPVGGFGRQRFAEFVAALAAHAVVGSGQESDGSVARAVGEKRRFERRLLPGFDVADDYGFYPAALFVHRYGAAAGEQLHVLLPGDERTFLRVLVVFGRPGVAFARVAEFADHAAQSLVGAKLDDAAQMHADFGAVVAAQHRAVVDQSDAAPQPGRRGRGAHACDAAAHDDEIERFGGLRRCGDAEHPFAECSEFRASGRRDVALFGGEIDGVAAAVESGKVGQRNADRTFPDGDLSGALPHPLAARAAERRGQFPAADPEGELSGTFPVVPGGDPVERPDVDPVGSRFREFDRRHGVRHGFAHAVRDEVGRTHLVHELLVHGPPALVAETLGLDQDAAPEGGGDGQQQRCGKQCNPLHGFSGVS